MPSETLARSECFSLKHSATKEAASKSAKSLLNGAKQAVVLKAMEQTIEQAIEQVLALKPEDLPRVLDGEFSYKEFLAIDERLKNTYRHSK
jgi:hypothetical protein